MQYKMPIPCASEQAMASMVNMEHLYKKEDESEESGTEAQACTWEAGVRPKCSVKSSNRVKSL